MKNVHVKSVVSGLRKVLQSCRVNDEWQVLVQWGKRSRRVGTIFVLNARKSEVVGVTRTDYVSCGRSQLVHAIEDTRPWKH